MSALRILIIAYSVCSIAVALDGLQLSDSDRRVESQPKLAKVQLQKTDSSFGLINVASAKDGRAAAHHIRRREASLETTDSSENSFLEEDIGWSVINQEVDLVIPMVLDHLKNLEVDHLELPDMKETISVSPLIGTYEAGLFLTNGIAYNLAGVRRHGDSYMTYKEKSFLSRFHLIIKNLQFEYNFVLKLMAIESYGKIIGSLDDTVISAVLAVNVINSTLTLHDFRIERFSNIHVQLDQSRLIGQLTSLILSPITNLFRDRITTSISDGLKEQMQVLMDDFNVSDPLELKKFTKKMLAGLTGQTAKT